MRCPNILIFVYVNPNAQLEDDNRKVLAGIIAANTAIFTVWRFSLRNPALERFMWRHFACSYNAVVHGKRLHTLVTSAFSHITFPHFGINMFMLWEFGNHVLAPSENANSWYKKALSNSKFAELFRGSIAQAKGQLLPLETFLQLYFGGAVASSVVSIAASGLRATPQGA